MMSAEEGGAGLVCGETEGEPRGGATIPHTFEDDKLCDALEGQHHPWAETCWGERGHDTYQSLVTEQVGAARSECNVDNNGEACCMSSEEGTIGESREKMHTMHSNCSSESSTPTPSCRICFQGAEQGDLLNPCRCDGSVRYMHQHCLLKWISERGCWTCELCCYRFHVIAINMKRPWQWQAITITLVEKVQIIAVFLGSLFLVASISWLLWSGLSPQAVWQRRDILFQICYGMYGFMDLVCIGLVVHEGAAVHNVFMRWRAVNLHWDVQNYDKAAALEETSNRDGSSVPRTLWLPLTTMGPGDPLHPSQLGSIQPWPRLCFRPLSICCPHLATRDSLSQDSGSGEVVVRVTSV